MFTKFEIGIMATALERYMGIYGYGQYQNLTEEEKRKHKKSLVEGARTSDYYGKKLATD